MLPSSIEHLLVVYNDGSPEYLFHPFIENGPEDLDSQKQATEWVLKHLPRTSPSK
jgi:hypothetical protein